MPQRGGLQEYAWNNKSIKDLKKGTRNPLRFVLLFLARLLQNSRCAHGYRNMWLNRRANQTWKQHLTAVHSSDGKTCACSLIAATPHWRAHPENVVGGGRGSSRAATCACAHPGPKSFRVRTNAHTRKTSCARTVTSRYRLSAL